MNTIAQRLAYLIAKREGDVTAVSPTFARVIDALLGKWGLAIGVRVRISGDARVPRRGEGVIVGAVGPGSEAIIVKLDDSPENPVTWHHSYFCRAVEQTTGQKP